MSIPKEPRQLMINLMYLVLTAMLALNVSAEIINAFFALNKGMKNSNGIVENSNGLIKQAIDKQVKAYPNPSNQKYEGLAAKAQSISKEFEAYIASVTSELVTAAGGVDPKHDDGRPIRYKDKDARITALFPSRPGLQRQPAFQLLAPVAIVTAVHQQRTDLRLEKRHPVCFVRPGRRRSTDEQPDAEQSGEEGRATERDGEAVAVRS